MAEFSKTNQPATRGEGEPIVQSNKRRTIMTDALMLALNEEVDDVAQTGVKTKRLRLIANKLAEKATEGDTQAISLVFDRTEGKAAQSITMDGELTMNPLTVLLQSIDGKTKTVDGSE